MKYLISLKYIIICLTYFKLKMDRVGCVLKIKSNISIFFTYAVVNKIKIIK